MKTSMYRPNFCTFALIFGCWLLAAYAALGAQRTWDGGGNDWDWRNTVNWDGNIIRLDPIEQGDSLVFPEGPTKLINTNDFGAGTNFNSLTYSGDDYASYGNMIGLSNGVTVTHASGATALYLPITLRQDQTFTVSSSTAFLHLIGDVNIGLHTLTFDGAGNFVTIGQINNSRFGGSRNVIEKNGTGRLTIFQPTQHDVPTIVNGGILAVESRMTNSIVTVNAGGTLRGSGRIGGLNAAGGIVQPGGTTPDALEVRGDVELGAGSILRLRLNGTGPGSSYDQLEVVGGGVTVGGALELTLGFAPSVGQSFTLIDNDGIDGVVGAFEGLPQNAVITLNGRPYRIRYGRGLTLFDGNDVTLEAIPGTSVWDGGGGQNRRWSEPMNWVGDVAPLPGDDLQFSAFTGSGSELRTTNDFPAGRAVGKITFIGGHHRVEGNLIQLHGGIDIDAHPTQPLTTLLRVEFDAPIVLGASQAFEVHHTNTHFFVNAALDLAAFNLRVDSLVRGSLNSSENSQITLRGGITGQGTLTKTGPGNISLLSASTCAQTIVNGGTFRSSSFSASVISGNVTVNSGGALEPDDDVLGDVTVNSGGLLYGGFHSSLGRNVDINGGVFRHLDTTSIAGNLRMRNGAEYHVSLEGGNAQFADANGVSAGGTLELAGCTVVFSLQPTVTFAPGDKLSVISSDSRTGTFAGLPDGARLALGGHTFRAQYNDAGLVLIADEPYAWDGGGGGNFWTTAGNWVGDYAPIGGSALTFPPGVGKLRTTNDFPAQTSFRAIEFSGSGYVLDGNRFTVTSLSNTFSSGQTLIHAPTSLADLVSVSGTSLLNLEGPLSGSTVDKVGTGTLRFSGAESNVIGIRVLDGQLELGKIGVPAISSTLQIGGSSNVAVAVLIRDDQIADSASVIVHASSRLEIGENSETIGSLSGAGTVRLGDVLFSGNLRVLGGSFGGTFTGRGALTKTGAATLTLLGTNAAIGSTILDQGTLAVHGAVNGAVRLDGGVLNGVGRVGSIVAAAGGILSPGQFGANFQNALNSGDVSLNAAVVFQPRLTSTDPSFENSYLQVAGVVSLGNATLSLSIPSPTMTPPMSKTYLIIANDGSDAISGGFAGMPEGTIFGSRGFAFRISYVGGTGNDVTVTRVQASPSNFNSIQALGNNRFLMQGDAIEGLEYNIQAASNLNPVINWIQVGRATGVSSGIFQFIHSNSPAIPMRFYRAVSP